jgi:hypothetical protein
MDGVIVLQDGTRRIIKDTRTPEQREEDLKQMKQRMEEYYNRPENAERKRDRDERRAQMAAMLKKWDEQDRATAEQKKQRAIEAAQYRKERDAQDAKFFLKHLCLLPFYIVALPFILVYFFLKSCIKNGFGKTVDSICDEIAGTFKVLPYIIFPPLLILEIFGDL